jgi:hypothetical protein
VPGAHDPVRHELLVVAEVAREAQPGPGLGAVGGIQAALDVLRVAALPRVVLLEPALAAAVAGLAADAVLERSPRLRAMRCERALVSTV